MKRLWHLKNLHLTLSSGIVLLAALGYGSLPEQFFSPIFDFTPNTIDLKNIFRAQMGMYLGLALFWILGTVRPHLWKGATTANILFMGGLALGRLLSMVVDGIPSTAFSLGVFGEMILALFAWFQLNKYGKVNPKNH